MKVLKKVVSCALALSLVVAPVMGANASNVSSTQGSAAVVSSDGTVATADIPSTSSVGSVTTTVTGVYLANKVNGTAITTGIADLKTGYGLTGNEKPYAKFSNMDAKKSYLAKACIDAAAAANGAEVGPLVNIELGKMAAGKYSLLSSDGANIRIAIGIPKSFAKDGMRYAVVCVRQGGVVSLLADVDSDPNTVTFDTKGGVGAYAIIRY